MSTRGGYGFVLDGKEIIVYTGSGADFTGLGYAVLNFLKVTPPEKIKKQVLELQEIDMDSPVTDEDIAEIQRLTRIKPRSRYDVKIDNWYHLLYLAQNDPQFLLDSQYFINSAWIISSVDLEFFYLINLDTKNLEIYHGYQRENHDRGRFEHLKNDPNVDKIPTLLRSYSFENLPDDFIHLDDELLEH